MGPIHAFSTGIRRAMACWPAWLALFLATLLVAVPLALFPAGSLLVTARRPVIEDMMGGLKTSQVIDAVRMMMNSSPAAGQPGLSDPALMQNMGYLLFLIVLLPLLGGLISAFIWGGVLVTYNDAGQGVNPSGQVDLELQAGPVPFRLGRFLWGCWHWFGSFLLLAVFQAGLFIALAVMAFGMLAASSALIPVVSTILLVLIVLFLGLWLAVFELARVQCVVNGTRNPFTGIGLSIQLIFNHMPVLIAYYALALVALLLVHLLFRGLVMPSIPPGVIALVLLAQQAFILARTFALALRLAGLTALAQAYRLSGAEPVAAALSS